MKFNHEQFIAACGGEKLKSGQRDGLDYLLTCFENDEHMTDIRWIAYCFGTTSWETGGTYQPIHERGSRQYFINRYGSQTKVGKSLGNDTPEEGAIYAGWGDVQLTGKSNYETAEVALRREYPKEIAEWEARTGKHFDLTVGDQPNDVNDPSNAGDPLIAYLIMSYGMRKGMFTGVGLPKYINADKCDYLNARKIINGLDHAAEIATVAEWFEGVLRDCQE